MLELILVLLVIVFVAWLAFLAGYIYRGYIIMNTVTQVLREVDAKTKDMVDRLHSTDMNEVEQAIGEAAKHLNITMLKYEHTDDQFYFYTKDTDTFVCQGKTLEEACANYYTKNKTSIGCVADPTEQTESFFIVEGKITHKLAD